MKTTYKDLSEIQIARYLGILGLVRREPSLSYLSALVRAHLMKAPFENISKLYYFQTEGMQTLPGIDRYLDGIEKYHFGGTCYANNYYLYQLLKGLEFDIDLCGCDMNNPDVHMVSIVRAEGHEYIVDVGYAAPFYKPIPADLNEDYEIKWGKDQYLLKPQDSQGSSILEQYRDGQYIHGYKIKRAARNIADFENVIIGSLAESATFRNAILLTRYHPGRSIRIHNQIIIETEGLKEGETRIDTMENITQAIETYFDIPQSITRKAMGAICRLESPWD